jgi:peptidoglycan hydrolase-like protein with peptidoglycan-binding domain
MKKIILTVLVLGLFVGPLFVFAATFNSELKVGSRGNEVKALQQELIKQGFLKGKTTSYFGNDTKTALVKYQKKNNLKQTGIVDAATRGKLNKITNKLIESSESKDVVNTPATVSNNTTLCNNKIWANCASGYKFVCPLTGDAYCKETVNAVLGDNNLYCNSKSWQPCNTGTRFVCPVKGDPYCEKVKDPTDLNIAAANKALAISRMDQALVIERDTLDSANKNLIEIEKVLNDLTKYSGRATDIFKEEVRNYRDYLVSTISIIRSYIPKLEAKKMNLLTSSLESYVSQGSPDGTLELNSAENAKNLQQKARSNYDDTRRLYESVLSKGRN